jgi:hypothetical protein
MAHTAIGIFHERAHAEAAVHSLMDNGFRRDKMDIAFSDPGESRGDVTDENATLNSKIGKFFLEVFKGDGDQALRYAAVAQRGVVIAVQADFYSDAQKAAALMDSCGAIDVEQESRIVEDGMTRSDRTLQSSKAVAKEKESLETSADAAAEYSNRQPATNSDDRRTGAYTMHSRIVERPINEDVRLREEQIWIERNETDQPDSGAALDEEQKV